MRIRKAAYWSSLAVIGLIFGAAGLMKVAGFPLMVHRMNAIGYGRPWQLFIGGTELLGVVALFRPRLRPIALVLLLPYAIGGLAVHISHHHSFWERDVEAVLVCALIPLTLALDPHLIVRWSSNLSQ